MTPTALRLYAWNLSYARALVADLSPARCTTSGGPGDPRLPATDAVGYPPMKELLAELARQHERVAGAWCAKLDGSDLGAPCLAEALEWRYGEALPTLGDAAVFLAVSHEALHLGQLAAWRRALGLPSAMALL